MFSFLSFWMSKICTYFFPCCSCYCYQQYRYCMFAVTGYQAGVALQELMLEHSMRAACVAAFNFDCLHQLLNSNMETGMPAGPTTTHKWRTVAVRLLFLFLHGARELLLCLGLINLPVCLLSRPICLVCQHVLQAQSGASMESFCQPLGPGSIPFQQHMLYAE